jgi:aryl-alcohol dehydrogenase-like predicted oxidoreductase
LSATEDRAIGVSNVDAAYLAEALALAPISVVQNEHSLLAREAERAPALRRAWRGVQAFSPGVGG